jgi:hypothetical protein
MGNGASRKPKPAVIDLSIPVANDAAVFLDRNGFSEYLIALKLGQVIST